MTFGGPGPAPQRAVCRQPGCGAAIAWVMTVRNRRMPLDAEPNPEGNVWLDHGWARSDGVIPDGATRYMPHHATCATPPARKAKARARSRGR